MVGICLGFWFKARAVGVDANNGLCCLVCSFAASPLSSSAGSRSMSVLRWGCLNMYDMMFCSPVALLDVPANCLRLFVDAVSSDPI